MNVVTSTVSLKVKLRAPRFRSRVNDVRDGGVVSEMKLLAIRAEVVSMDCSDKLNKSLMVCPVALMYVVWELTASPRTDLMLFRSNEVRVTFAV